MDSNNAAKICAWNVMDEAFFELTSCRSASSLTIFLKGIDTFGLPPLKIFKAKATLAATSRATPELFTISSSVILCNDIFLKSWRRALMLQRGIIKTNFNK